MIQILQPRKPNQSVLYARTPTKTSPCIMDAYAHTRMSTFKDSGLITLGSTRSYVKP